MVGEVREQRDERVAGDRPRRARPARRRRCGGRARHSRRARQRDTASPVKSPTASGPVTNANASSVITTWSKQPSASAGPETHAPVTASSVGTTPETATSSPGQPTPRVQRGDAFAELGTRGVELADERHLQLPGELHRPLDGRAAGGADRAVVLAAGDAEPHDAPPVDDAQLGRRGAVGAGPDRRRPGLPDHGSRHEVCVTRFGSRGGREDQGRVVPAESERVRERGGRARLRAARRTRRRAGSRRRCCSRFAVGGTDASRIASRHATASVAPAAPTRCPVTPLVDVTGGADSPNTLRIASASAASLSGVEVPCAFTCPIADAGSAGVVERELHARGRALAAG